jgi:hypothetical protein
MSRFIITADWDNNAPHLSEKARADLYASIPAYQKDARTKGIPQLGAGVIYPIPDDEIIVDPFAIPPHWPRGYGLDVGWNRTAAMFTAMDPDTRVQYFYDEYYRGETAPEIHAMALRQRCALLSGGQRHAEPWIPGRIDPAARGRQQKDGDKLLTLYQELIYGTLEAGRRLLQKANNAVETGIYQVLMRLQQGLLKVFRGRCPNWMAERRLYRRDEKGRVVKQNDHAQDAGRYGIASGDAWFAQEPVALANPDRVIDIFGDSGGWGDESLSWMRS